MTHDTTITRRVTLSGKLILRFSLNLFEITVFTVTLKYKVNKSVGRVLENITIK